MKKLILALLLVSFSTATAYAGSQERGMATGAAVGATAGAVIGSQTNETAKGAIMGAMFGAIAGAILSDVHATPVHYSRHQSAHVKRDYRVHECRHGHYRNRHAYRHGKHHNRGHRHYRDSYRYQKDSDSHDRAAYHDRKRQPMHHARRAHEQRFSHGLIRPGIVVDRYAYAGR